MTRAKKSELSRPTPKLRAVLCRLRPEQWDALLAEGFKRAAAEKRGRSDASGVLRDIIDEWMSRETADPEPRFAQLGASLGPLIGGLERKAMS